MTREKILSICPQASEDTIRKTLAYHVQGDHAKNHAARLCANNPEPTKGRSLERVAPRKAPGGRRSAHGFEIIFTVYATRPADWDGYSVKELQDMVVHAGILPGDDWRILQGSVISDKAHSEAEVRTEIELIQIMHT